MFNRVTVSQDRLFFFFPIGSVSNVNYNFAHFTSFSERKISLLFFFLPLRTPWEDRLFIIWNVEANPFHIWFLSPQFRWRYFLVGQWDIMLFFDLEFVLDQIFNLNKWLFSFSEKLKQELLSICVQLFTHFDTLQQFSFGLGLLLPSNSEEMALKELFVLERTDQLVIDEDPKIPFFTLLRRAVFEKYICQVLWGFVLSNDLPLRLFFNELLETV